MVFPQYDVSWKSCSPVLPCVGFRFSTVCASDSLPLWKIDNVHFGGLCPSKHANNVVKGEHNNKLIVLSVIMNLNCTALCVFNNQWLHDFPPPPKWLIRFIFYKRRLRSIMNRFDSHVMQISSLRINSSLLFVYFVGNETKKHFWNKFSAKLSIFLKCGTCGA